jgi:DNA invertase Pin-like site-specific DNA recombinase
MSTRQPARTRRVTWTDDKPSDEHPLDAGNAVIYVRVSSAQQAETDYDAEGFSIPAQRDACQRKAASLGYQVVEEFVDRGESAKTANRPGLRALLARIEHGDINAVIVHKIDRLSRSRADDVQIAMQIRATGAQLVSATENIDETASGQLLHGIMSSIAEFYSRNLATEIMKGTTQKAKNGGTPFKAPIGYLNTREWIDGHEIRTIMIDPERAPLVQLAFELYATGDYSLLELCSILEARGLRSKPTRNFAAKPLGPNRLSSLLRNVYYIGIVEYAGTTYQGRHRPLIDEGTFDAVQDILAAQRQSGERSWRHHHYLRGTLYCKTCGKRLFFTQAKGRHGGTFDYFICGGRSARTCPQRHHRVAAVEAAVERHYATIQLTSTQQDRIREAVRAHLGELAGIADKETSRARAEVTRLDNEERKLLAAHYQDRISDHIFQEEQKRIRWERIAADQLLQRFQIDQDAILDTLDLALQLTDSIQTAYLNADPTERRLLNQAIFQRIEIDAEDTTGHELQPVFAQIAPLAHSFAARPGKKRTPAKRAGGSDETLLVELGGLEPPTSWVRWTCPSRGAECFSRRCDDCP